MRAIFSPRQTLDCLALDAGCLGALLAVRTSKSERLTAFMAASDSGLARFEWMARTQRTFGLED